MARRLPLLALTLHLSGGGVGRGGGDRVQLGRGDTLHARPGGPVVGIVKADELSVHAHERRADGWVRVRDHRFPLALDLWARARGD